MTGFRVSGARNISKKSYRIKWALSLKIKTVHIDIYNIHLLEGTKSQTA